MGSGICFPYWIWQVLKPSVVFLFLTYFHQNSYTLNLNNVENPNGSGFLGYYTSVDGWFITVYITMDDENSSGYPVSIRFGPWLVSLINVGGNWNCCTTSSTHWVNHGCCHTWSYMGKLDWWQKGSWGKNGDAHPARILPKNAHAAQAQAVRRHHQQERIRPGERWSGEPWIQPPETQPWPRDWPTTGDSITTCRWEPASKAPTTAPSTKRKLPPPLKVVGSPPHRYCSCAPYRRPCCLTCF